MNQLSPDQTLDLLDAHGVRTESVSAEALPALTALLSQVPTEVIDAFLAFAPTDYTNPADFSPVLLDTFMTTYVGTYASAHDFVIAWATSPRGQVRGFPSDPNFIQQYVDMDKVFEELISDWGEYTAVGERPVHVFARHLVLAAGGFSTSGVALAG